MQRRPVVAILNSIEASGAQVIYDNTACEWAIVKTAAAKELLIGSIPYGKTVKVEYFDPLGERRQLITVGATATTETIVASTRYQVTVWNPEDSYETQRQVPIPFSYTSSATLSGTAATDRAVVFRALRDKINNYPRVFCTAYTLTYAAYTGGTSSGDADTNFAVGEIVTQETSGLTAQVALCTITTGTFAGDNAAGNIWLFNLSNETTWLTTAKTLTAVGHAAATILLPATTNCVVSVTNATTVHGQGLAIRDNAGYFTSAIARGGKNYVGLTQGFATLAPVVSIAAVYSLSIGDDMIAQKPVFDVSNQDLIHGNLRYDFQNSDLPVSGYTYEKCVITVADGDEEAMGGIITPAYKQYIVYANYADSDLADFKTALTTIAAY